MKLDKNIVREPLLYVILFVVIALLLEMLGARWGWAICGIGISVTLFVMFHTWIKKRHCWRNDIAGEGLGTVPEKPLYFHSKNDMDPYMQNLLSADGEKLNWKLIEKDLNTYSYEAALPSGEYYGTLYFQVCGIYTTEHIPEGYCQDKAPKEKVIVNKRVFFTNAFSFVISAVVVFALFLLLFVQDPLRNANENWNPLLCYIVLMLFAGAVTAVSFFSFRKSRFALTMILSILLLIVAIVISDEGSVHSTGFYDESDDSDEYYSDYYDYYGYGYGEFYWYANEKATWNLNRVWEIGAYLICAVNMVHILFALLFVVRSSVWYHDFHYWRAFRMRKYQEAKVITEGMNEKYKQEITKHVKY